RYGEYAGAQNHPARHLQLPERIVADGNSGRIFQRAGGRVEQAPIAAHRSFPAPLPRLVIGLEQVDAITALPCTLENFSNETRLVEARRQRYVAHPPLAWPAGLADQDLLAGKGSRDLRADVIDMRGGVFGAHRRILPIGQEMNGDEIDVG